MSNCVARNRKIKKIRGKIKHLSVARLSVHRTPRHIYAQVINTDGKVLAAASSLEKSIKQNEEVSSVSGKIEIAKLVGKLVAERSKDKVNKIAFDRSGFKYHGRVKALADSARENGLSF